ncbi:MAG: S8 family peptidase, partial [Paracoccaceae bacterium]
MVIKNSLLGMIGLGLLSACNPNDDGLGGGTFTISHVPSSVLSDFFVADFALLETAATALRTLNPLYTIQQFSWWNGPGTPVYDSYSIANGRVEYAHAAGLTGAGQTISIVDAGFLQSHIEFTGKSITTPSGSSAPGIDSHGTSVASVAAGVAGSGSIIGVAPGASLQLGSFNTNSTRTDANNQAITVGAIVQNNSWGFEIDATTENFQLLFSGSSGAAYYTSITNLAQSAVIVFAASNDVSRTTTDIMSALPLFSPGLQTSWVTVINAVPIFSGSTITSGTVISSSCFEAAAWCMAADGSVYAAVSTSDSDYSDVYGSSFAAPQVSGAIALLAQAFPGLTAEELRARLLASADNGFYTHTGYVEFAPGLQHGYSDEFGHGFLNMK